MRANENQARRVVDDLRARYAAPGRHYHTEAHVREMLGLLSRLVGPDDLPLLTWAAWFHDAVYDSRASDNEERSAALADERLPEIGLPKGETEEIVRLILATKTHDVPDGDLRGAAFLDADLAILGAPEAEYDTYAAAIRMEFAWVEEDTYRAGRARLLRGFLARPRIYRTATLSAEREARARINLTREAERLERAG